MPRGNWVDRGDALESALARVLGHALRVDATDSALLAHVLTIRGLVEADSTEVHVAAYLHTMWEAFGQDALDPSARRTLGIALWHIAKAGLVRDTMRRELAAVRRTQPNAPPLSVQLHDAILRAPVPPAPADPVSSNGSER
jgi:hypothetical protein